MIPIISPKYQMKLITEVEKKLWDLFPDKKYMNVLFYIEKWHEEEFDLNNSWENFTIYKDERKNKIGEGSGRREAVSIKEKT